MTSRDEWIIKLCEQHPDLDSCTLAMIARDAMAWADAHREGQEEVAALMEEVAKKVAMIRALEADVSRLMAILG